MAFRSLLNPGRRSITVGMHRLIRFAALLVATAPALVFGWTGNGHEVIAGIAWQRLTPAVRQRIGKILMEGDTHFRPTNPSDPESVRKAFCVAATWSDEIKFNPSPLYDRLIETENTRFPGVSPPAGSHLNVKGEEVRCKTWHYYDVPVGGTGHPARASNALVALTQEIIPKFKQSAAINSHNGDRQACFFLYWIEHVFGDLHQPLHAASYFGGAHAAHGDHGGNLYSILVPDPQHQGQFQTLALHRFWDEGIDHALAADRLTQENAPQAWLQNRSLLPTAANEKDLSPKHWIAESARLAATNAYSAKEGKPLTRVYVRNHIALCRKQAILGGYRLAYFLNLVLSRRS